VISDEIEIIEANAIQKTAIGNWPGARVQFERALMLEMPALRRAQILRNGRDVLEREFSAHGSGDGATSRRGSRLSGRDQRRSGEPQRRTSQHHYLDGTKTAHWDRLVRSRLYRRSLLGPQCREWSAHESNTHTRCPPFACLAVAWATVGGMSSRTLGAAATLYANFLFSFGIGYAAAASRFCSSWRLSLTVVGSFAVTSASDPRRTQPSSECRPDPASGLRRSPVSVHRRLRCTLDGGFKARPRAKTECALERARHMTWGGMGRGGFVLCLLCRYA
jgi:hypothetical protein